MSSEMPFQDPHNWVGTTPQDADTHYSIHCSSTQWLQLIHIAPLWKLLDCLFKRLCWAPRPALSSATIWTTGENLFVTDWHLQHLLRATVPSWFISYTPVNCLSGNVFNPSSLLCRPPTDSSSPYGQIRARTWGWLFWAHHISRRSIFTTPAGTLETA